MDDKTIMASILGNVKGEVDLMMHGAIESATPDVRSTFETSLSQTLCLQKEIYDKMAAKGWYQIPAVEQTKITQAKQKYAAN